MVIISCRFWHKMQQIWHKILKKVHRTCRMLGNKNTQSITILWVKESLIQTSSAVLQILQNHHIFLQLYEYSSIQNHGFYYPFCCCNQILFIFGNFCFTIILYLDEHKSFLSGYCQMDQSFFRIWN